MAKKWQIVCPNTECYGVGVDYKPCFRFQTQLLVDENKQSEDCTTYEAECFICDYCETRAIAGDEE